MIATAVACAALALIGWLEAADPMPMAAALNALDAASANALPVLSTTGFLAMTGTHAAIAAGVASFLYMAAAACGAGRLAAAWARWGNRDALGVMSAVALGGAATSSVVLGCAAIRLAHLPVIAAILLMPLVIGRGPATLRRLARASRAPVLGWVRPLTILTGLVVLGASLAPATSDTALSATLPVAAGLRWGEAGAVEALMGMSQSVDAGVTDAIARIATLLGLDSSVQRADASARLWSVAGLLVAGLALAAAFRPREVAGRWLAVAVVCTSPGLVRLALDDHPRLFMLAPAVLCAGMVTRGRLGRGAVMAVIAGWFGAGGDPGHVAKVDLARLAAAGLAAGVLLVSTGSGRLLRAAVAGVLLLCVMRTVTMAASTGGLLAGVGLESHPAFISRALGVQADLVDRLGREGPKTYPVWLSGEARAWPPVRRFLTDAVMVTHLDDGDARPDRYGPRLRQVGIRRVVHRPGPDQVLLQTGRLISSSRDGSTTSTTTRTDGSWLAWWAGHALMTAIPDRLDGMRGGYYFYDIEQTPGDRAKRPATAPLWYDSAQTWFPWSQARSVLVAFDDDFVPSPQEDTLLHAAERDGYRSVLLYHALARAAAARGGLDEALGWLDRLDALDARSAATARLSLLRSLATAARARRDPAAAEKHLRAALDIDPRDAAAWAELSEILLWLGRKPEALDAMERATRLNPDHPGYRGTLGHMRRAS